VSALKSFPLLSVHILRGKDVITVEVPKHEVRVLQAVHGPEKVSVVGETDNTVELSADLGAEIDRLRRTYRQVGKPDAVDVAYPNAFGLDGFEVATGPAVKGPQSAVKDHKKLAKEQAAKDAKPADGKK
jgi:hypothetical protein